MNINNLKSCIPHDEATIRSFIRDPEFAEYYLNSVIADGDEEEIREVQAWYDEAKIRSKNVAPSLSYWNSVATNAKLAVQDGHDLNKILSFLNEAVGTVKAAMI